MRKSLVILSILALSVSCNSQNETSNPDVKLEVIQPKVFKAIIDTATNIQIVDVRTPEECSAGMIEGAVNINFYDTDFRDQVSALDRDKTTLIYCRSGGRSGKAAEVLEGLGFKVIYDLSGGYMNWK